MTTKIEQFIAYPKVKKVKTGNFFDLILQSSKKIKRGKKGTLSRDVDKIVYGYAK